MGQLILARPGTTDFDDQERIVGTLDIPVNVRGQAEVAEMARELDELPIDTIYAAAGTASRQTADLLAKHGAEVKPLNELTNLDFGLWQGLPIDEVRRKHPKVFKQWMDSPGTVCPPAGVMLDAVRQRLEKPLKKVVRRGRVHYCVLVAPTPLRQLIRSQILHTEPSDLLHDQNQRMWEIVAESAAS